MKLNRNIKLMYAICLLQGMVFYGAIATLYRQAVGVNVFQITIIESISLTLAIILELPWGILAEKIGYKNTMIVCCVIYFISKIVFWKANGFGMLLLERILLAVVISGYSGVDESILYLSCEKSEAHKVFSIYDSLGTVGLILASGVYNIVMHGNYRLAGFATVITYGIAMILTLFLKEVKTAEKKEEHPLKEFLEVLRSISKQKEIFLFLIGIALFRECNQTITIFLNQLQYVRAGMNDQMIGWAYVATTVIGLLGMRSVSFVKRFGKRKSGVLLFGFAGMACLILMITSNPIFSILSIFCIRVTFSIMAPLSQTIQNEMVVHKNRASALSVNAVIMDGIAVTTSMAFGKASDVYLPLAFGLGVGFCMIGLVLFLWSLKRMGDKKTKLKTNEGKYC